MSQIELAIDVADPSEIPNPDGPRADLPIIQLPGNDFTITESADVLFRLIARVGNLFIRDGVVMRPCQDAEGILKLAIVKPEAARSDFEKYGQLVVGKTVDGKKVKAPALCSTEIAKALLQSAEAKQHLPNVNGLINCPVIYECAGELRISNPGYDAYTKRLVTGGKSPENVDFIDARDALLGILSDFDFQSAGDKSRALSSIIAPALKLGGFLKYRVPADIAQADKSQAGKGYRQKVIAAIYNETISVVANRKGGVGSLDESFSFQLLEGRPFIQFDNLRIKLDSENLEAFFTTDRLFPCRVPHHGTVNVNPAGYFIFITSNGFETTTDLANRSAIIRIRKRPHDFTFKKYDEGDVLAHVRAKQPFFLGCVFSIIREWHKRGRPHSEETRHDFKEWVQTMDWIVQNLFGQAPLMEGHSEAQELVSNAYMVFLRQVCIAALKVIDSEEPQTANEIAAICEAEGIQIPGLRIVGNPEICARQVGTCLAQCFKDSESVDIEGYRVERRLVPRKRGDGNGYFDSKSYVFTVLNAACALQQENSLTGLVIRAKSGRVIEKENGEYPRVTRSDGGSRVSFVYGQNHPANRFQKPQPATADAGTRDSDGSALAGLLDRAPTPTTATTATTVTPNKE